MPNPTTAAEWVKVWQRKVAVGGWEVVDLALLLHAYANKRVEEVMEAERRIQADLIQQRDEVRQRVEAFQVMLRQILAEADNIDYHDATFRVRTAKAVVRVLEP